MAGRLVARAICLASEDSSLVGGGAGQVAGGDGEAVQLARAEGGQPLDQLDEPASSAPSTTPSLRVASLRR